MKANGVKKAADFSEIPAIRKSKSEIVIVSPGVNP